MALMRGMPNDAALMARLPTNQELDKEDPIEILAAAFVEEIGDAANLEQALGIPSELIDECYGHGLAAYQAGDYEQAQQIFSLVSLARSDDPHASMALASALQQLGDYRAALESYLLAQRGLPDDAGVLFRIAECQLALDEYALAREALQQCLGLCAAGPATPDLYQHATALMDQFR